VSMERKYSQTFKYERECKADESRVRELVRAMRGPERGTNKLIGDHATSCDALVD
jgi:hypothetical protein